MIKKVDFRQKPTISRKYVTHGLDKTLTEVVCKHAIKLFSQWWTDWSLKVTFTTGASTSKKYSIFKKLFKVIQIITHLQLTYVLIDDFNCHYKTETLLNETGVNAKLMLLLLLMSAQRYQANTVLWLWQLAGVEARSVRQTSQSDQLTLVNELWRMLFIPQVAKNINTPRA